MANALRDLSRDQTKGFLLPRFSRTHRNRGALAIALAMMVALTALALVRGGERANGAPSVNELRAQVQRIQAEVAGIDEQVGMAAEAYNGAVYQLDLVNRRIGENTAALKRATARLTRVQGELGARLRAAYVTPPPTRMQLLLSSQSASALLSGGEAMQRAAARDGEIIRAVKALRQERITKAAELTADRTQAKKEVAQRANQRAVVQGLLRRRQTVLSSAKGQLARELAAEQAREVARRRAANRRARALVNSQRLATAPSAAPVAGRAPAGSSATVSGPGSARNAQAARIAMQYLGVPYVWGGGTPSGFDCSGLAQYAYAKVGVSMAHYTGSIYSAFPRGTGPLQPGDMVFFSGLGHMGIYLGNGLMVHAPHTGDVVRVSPIAGRRYVGAVRPS